MKKIYFILAALMLLAFPASASNPEITETEPGAGVYCGDPAATVVDTDGDGEGDTVYLYVGQDDSTSGYYRMPRYLCYSSTDMVNWKYEGSPMSANDFTGWGGTDESWAGQVIEYNGKFYYYMCKNASGISVGVADSPTGPFTALEGGPLVWRELTDGSVWQRTIDPTVWIETDENGVEHRYLGYGNGNIYLAELNEDMTSIMDIDGSGDLNKGDIKELIVEGWPSGIGFTEAPWIYRRPGDSRYYLFFASRWREELSYATADNIWGPYQYGGTVMAVGASSNTNHPAVIDFKGETYIIYHTGARERGSGYSRSVCIDRLHFDENGEVAQLEESSIGLDGTAS
ncbi:MAG: family 43 glycosylhydrolase, partial [Oscillospiraceae bacterium]|nr:family 43 glycosylhydrolase [Oscillospiraceae bacterium]